MSTPKSARERAEKIAKWPLSPILDAELFKSTVDLIEKALMEAEAYGFEQGSEFKRKPIWVKTEPFTKELEAELRGYAKGIEDAANAVRVMDDGEVYAAEIRTLQPGTTNASSSLDTLSEAAGSDAELEAAAREWANRCADSDSEYAEYDQVAFMVGARWERERMAKLWPSDGEIRDYFQWSKDVKVTTPLQAFEVLRWLRSKLGT